jgi:signal transduction histidine kinase
MPPKQVVHSINNQLTIVIGRASMLAAESDDLTTKKRCEEIETAAQNISRLLNRISVND